MKILALAACLDFPWLVAAEVTDLAPNGLRCAETLSIKAAPADVYQKLVA